MDARFLIHLLFWRGGIEMAVGITRTDRSAAELRREAARTRDSKASRRMLAMALVLDGRNRTEAAESCGMDRQTLRDWVHRYNAEGLAGLSDRPLPGRTPILNAEKMSELAAIVEAGPDPETDGVVRWRRTLPVRGRPATLRGPGGGADDGGDPSPARLREALGAPAPPAGRRRGAGAI